MKVLGHGEAVKHGDNGRIDLTYTGAVWSGPRAFEEAGVAPADIGYASIYDSFTITVLQTLEDLGFCAKGEGGRFVVDGTLQAPHGRLPFNTDGGGLCNNHPGNRGGMTKILEAVRQLRGEAHPAVQVPNPRLALAHGTGGSIATRMGSRHRHPGHGGRLTWQPDEPHCRTSRRSRTSRTRRSGTPPPRAACCSSAATPRGAGP